MRQELMREGLPDGYPPPDRSALRARNDAEYYRAQKRLRQAQQRAASPDDLEYYRQVIKIIQKWYGDVGLIAPGSAPPPDVLAQYHELGPEHDQALAKLNRQYGSPPSPAVAAGLESAEQYVKGAPTWERMERDVRECSVKDELEYFKEQQQELRNVLYFMTYWPDLCSSPDFGSKGTYERHLAHVNAALDRLTRVATEDATPAADAAIHQTIINQTTINQTSLAIVNLEANVEVSVKAGEDPAPAAGPDTREETPDETPAEVTTDVPGEAIGQRGAPPLSDKQALKVFEALQAFTADETRKKWPFKSNKDDRNSLCNFVRKLITDRTLKQEGIKDRISRCIKYARKELDVPFPPEYWTNTPYYFKNSKLIQSARVTLQRKVDGAAN